MHVIILNKMISITSLFFLYLLKSIHFYKNISQTQNLLNISVYFYGIHGYIYIEHNYNCLFRAALYFILQNSVPKPNLNEHGSGTYSANTLDHRCFLL